LYDTYSGGHSNEQCPPSPAELEQLARKALELDPESGEAWISLGVEIRRQVDGSPESMPRLREAIAAFERGLELNPNMSQGYHWYGMALPHIFLYPDPPRGWIEAYQAGVWESVYDKGLEVDPLSIPLHYMKAYYPLQTRSAEEAIWHGHRMVEIAPESPRGYETLGEHAWFLSGRIDESIRWVNKAAEIDPQHPLFLIVIGRAYSALGDTDMALAYIDLARALTAPDNQPLQDGLLVEQAVIQLVSGKEKAPQIAELPAVPRESTRGSNLQFAIFIDLRSGRPADALARVEKLAPKCLAAKSIPGEYLSCPTELIRIYQELGDYTAAENLGDAIVQREKLWSDGYPANGARLVYAGALAVTGRADEALDVLKNLVSSGWRGNRSLPSLRFTLYFDLNFDAIRDDERFQAIVATIEADMAQQLENVREMQRRGELPTLEELKVAIASNESAPEAASGEPDSTSSKQ
jgi:tetratricopeptide (TPR) repeat protein